MIDTFSRQWMPQFCTTLDVTDACKFIEFSEISLSITSEQCKFSASGKIKLNHYKLIEDPIECFVSQLGNLYMEKIKS